MWQQKSIIFKQKIKTFKNYKNKGKYKFKKKSKR